MSTQELRTKYASALSTLSAIFPDWSDDDLLLVLDESKGSIETAATRITEGQSAPSTSPPITEKERTTKEGRASERDW